MYSANVVDFIVVPRRDEERFAELSGLTEGVVQGMIEKGHLPSIKFGRYRMINLARLRGNDGSGRMITLRMQVLGWSYTIK